MIEIEISNQQDAYPVDEPRLVSAAHRVLQGEGIRTGVISVAIVDDATIHELNRRYLQHDYATDVLSFVLEENEDHLEGEVIVSADTAAANCARFGWSLGDELLLYVVHGMLHLAGCDDHSPADQQVMREREKHYLSSFGVQARYEEALEDASLQPDDDTPTPGAEDVP
ncbi:MAG: rRNA maturation RNase YbeY [Planctomycetes bacterium]|nr:rRNA maturation RNase YbeY [Planctomycetota bacterium]